MDLGSSLRKNASLFGSRTAVVFEDQRLSFAELYERSVRLARGLMDLGLQKGDRVATLGDNMMESVEEMSAIALSGFARTPLYTQNPADVSLYMLRLTGARALIVQDRYYKELAPRLNEAPALERVIVHGVAQDGTHDYDELLDRTERVDPQVTMADDDLCQIRFSARTTGRPKGIAHTVAGLRQIGTEFGLMAPRMDEEDAYLACGPISHGAGLFAQPIIATGAKIVVMRAFDPGTVLELIERERVSLIFLVPTMIQMIVNHPTAKTRDLSSMRAIFYGAAPIAERTLVQALEVWGNIMYQFCGQSEGGPATALTPKYHVVDGSERERRRLRSAGRPTPNSIVRIVDDEGRELPVGEVGEITFRSAGNMQELWGDPEGTRERLNPGGWLHTRDMGFVDEDGFLYISDRKEDMIISGGFNIWPAEIENALFSHPSVLEAAVVGVPHEKWGETPVAVVVLREGASTSEQELMDWCRDRVGSVKKPTAVVISSDPLPKSGVGKVPRRLVREQFWEGRDQQVAGS